MWEIILKFIPKSYLKIVDINTLLKLLNNQITANIKKLKKIKDSISNSYIYAESGKEVLLNFLQKSDIYGLDDIDQGDIGVAKVLAKLITNISNKSGIDFKNLQEIYLYAIGKSKQFNVEIDNEKIFNDLNNQLFKDVVTENSMYKVDYVDENQQPHYFNKIIYAYLTVGESEVRWILKKDGYSNAQINRIMPKIIAEANRQKERYKVATDKIDKFRNLDEVKQAIEDFEKFGIRRSGLVL